MWTPPGYSVVALSWRSCSFGSAGLVLSHVQTKQTLEGVISKPWIWACIVAELVSPALSFIHRASSPALLWLGHSMLTNISRRQGQLSCYHILEDTSSTPCHCATQSIAAACEGLGQLSSSHILGAGSLVPSPILPRQCIVPLS